MAVTDADNNEQYRALMRNHTPKAKAERTTMSNTLFLIVVTAIIAGLLGFLSFQKAMDCIERGGIACPVICDSHKFRKICGDASEMIK